MSALLFAALMLAGSAGAVELVVRNDTAFDDSFDTSDAVAWLAFPECAIAVLTPDPADLPLSIDTIRFYFGSSQGNQDGTDTLAEVGIQLLAEGAAPTGPGDWAWGEEGFLVTVQSTSLTDLNLDQPEEGLYPLQVTEGSMAVWICPPDPTTGEGWPFSSGRDTSGIVIHSDSPDAGNYLFVDGAVHPLADFGAHGSWIIRAIQDAEGGGSGGGSGDGGGDGGGSGDGASDGSSGGGDGGVDTASPLGIDRIVPQRAVLGEAVEVVILGQGFGPDSGASIGGLPLSSLEGSGSGALAGRSPSGLPVGVHDVTVDTRDGGAVTLQGAFTVTAAEELEEVDESIGRCGCAAGGVGALGISWLLAPLMLMRRRPNSVPVD